MGKGSSGHKQNYGAKRKRAIYKLEGRMVANRLRKQRKQLKENPEDLSNPLHPEHKKSYAGPKAKVVVNER